MLVIWICSLGTKEVMRLGLTNFKQSLKIKINIPIKSYECQTYLFTTFISSYIVF